MRTILTRIHLQAICIARRATHTAVESLSLPQGPDLAAVLEQKLYAEFPTQTSNNAASIYRVPDRLRSVEPKAYEPNIVSIGPYHHGAARLQAMEHKKWKCFHGLFNPSKSNNRPNLNEVLNELKEMEQQARACDSADDSYLCDVLWKINCYCNDGWNQKRAKLKHEYFYNVWVSLSTVAAIIIIYFTILQTISGLGEESEPSHLFGTRFWVSFAKAFAIPFGGYKQSKKSSVSEKDKLEIFEWLFGDKVLDDMNPLFFMSC